MCAFFCGSAEGYQAAMQKYGAEIRGDIVNYTDIAPVIQVSEVVVERSGSLNAAALEIWDPARWRKTGRQRGSSTGSAHG
jgi:hypothetical protein